MSYTINNDKIIFDDNFNQLVENLPNNITHLTFGLHFNQLVDNLSNNITHLTFGNDKYVIEFGKLSTD